MRLKTKRRGAKPEEILADLTTLYIECMNDLQTNGIRVTAKNGYECVNPVGNLACQLAKMIEQLKDKVMKPDCKSNKLSRSQDVDDILKRSEVLMTKHNIPKIVRE
jgi:hypothetical protein